ncbi:ABATE domain-containing protein [Streptomyces sp. NPDC026672]|uniref:CGNR zinc finger domain-containing protein n=1 Tax=unclassified Streptomyces TaxID=2593676 RepID=UPI0033F6AC17
MAEALSSDAALQPAPGEDQYCSLALANSLMTLTGGRVVDRLATPEGANEWLAEHDLTPADLGLRESCATQLRVLREHVRALLASRADGLSAPLAAVTALNQAMTSVPTSPLLQWDEKTGPYRVTTHPTAAAVDFAIAHLAANAADLLTGPDADRLTACGSTPCSRFLLRRGRRHWCSTRCGDRARAARAYARRTDPEAN